MSTDREVVELLRDDPDLLAVADAIAATQPTGARRNRAFALRVVAVAAVVAVAGGIALVAPWHGHGSRLVDRALAAVGQGPVLHAVIESTVPNESVVNLSTGATRPVPQRLEYWFDSERRVLRARTSVLGEVMVDDVIPPSRLDATAPPLDPALTGFLSAYRDALKNGQAREGGRGVFDGRSVLWLRFDYRLFGERVGVDERSYRPIVIEPLNPDGTPADQIWRVSSIDTRAYRPSDFTSRRRYPVDRSTGGGNISMITPSQAARRLGWRPVWLGTSFGSLPLQHTQLLASTTARSLLLSYGRGANRIQLTEAKTVGDTFWLLGLGVPSLGDAVVFRSAVSGPGPIKTTCQGLVRVRGVWVQIEGWNEASSRCVDAARTLVRMEP